MLSPLAVLCAAALAPAAANAGFDVHISGTQITTADPTATVEGRLRVFPYTNSSNVPDPGSVFDYRGNFVNQSPNLTLIDDDGDGEPGEPDEGSGEAGENCSFYTVTNSGGQNVKCKVLTSLSSSGSPAGDSFWALQPTEVGDELLVNLRGAAGSDSFTVGGGVEGNLNGETEAIQTFPYGDVFEVEPMAADEDWTVDLSDAGTETSTAGGAVTALEFEHFTGTTVYDDVGDTVVPVNYNVTGNADNNTLRTTDGSDTISGLGGVDDIIATDQNLDGLGADNNTLTGGPGIDRIDAGYGDDVIWGDDPVADRNTQASGVADGNDSVETLGGADLVHTAGGNDTVEIGQDTGLDANHDFNPEHAAKNVSVWLGTGDDTVTMDIYDPTGPASSGVMTVQAGDGNDNITLAHAADSVTGGLGNDTIRPGTGADQVNAGDGDDTVRADEGDSDQRAGDGADVVRTAKGADTVYAGGANDEVHAGADADYVDCGAGTADTLTDKQEHDTVVNCENTPGLKVTLTADAVGSPGTELEFAL